jgi:hypothetical protein
MPRRMLSIMVRSAMIAITPTQAYASASPMTRSC